MQNLKNLVTTTYIVLFITISGVLAQEPGPDPSEVEIPFIDRDGDGINDLLQSGWGLRFMERYKKRQLIWEQLNVQTIKGKDGPMVDTDGDGKGDKTLQEFLKEQMDKRIDTDDDGVPDTTLKDYLGRQFRAFDNDGDGLPDDISKDELRKKMNQMKKWRDEIHERIRQGLPPFIDDNGDGIPDNLPDGFGWRGSNRKNGGK